MRRGGSKRVVAVVVWAWLSEAMGWRDMEIELLEPLAESESVESWFARNTHPKSVNDSDWWAYQQEVLALCKPLWTLVQPGKRLADFDFLDLWHQSMPQFGRFVYVPLPWHHIVEQHGMLRKEYGPLKQASRIFERLDFEAYDHFITLGQASFPQIKKYCKRAGFGFSNNLDKLKLIFTSRLENLDRVAKDERLVREEIPIPLLYRRDQEARPYFATPMASKRRAAFFAGSCTCPMRTLIAPGVQGSTDYDMTRVHPCGKKIPRSVYIKEIANSTWVLTPRGSFPAAYMMSEAVQSGSLPVYVYGSKYNSSRPLPPVDFVAKHLPFVNMGLDWRRLGLVVTADDIPRIPSILAKIDPTPRLQAIRRLRTLFTIDGTFRYLLVVLSHYAKAHVSHGSSPPVAINRRIRAPLIQAPDIV